MKLIIVESPTKAKTISKFLGKDFVVESSYGHLRDLPKSKIGIDTKKDFTPTYVIPKKAVEIAETLKEKAGKAGKVILATDEDREGEAIAWHLEEALDLKKRPDEEMERIVFHEITESAIREALANPRKIDMHLVDAQQARRVLDRLVGYELSPFLWRKIRYGLSAGRVQSVTLRLIVEREREIQNFKIEEYWSVEAKLAKRKNGPFFSAKLYSANGNPLGKMGIENESEAKKIISDLNGADYAVSGIATRDTARMPPPPFTTSTLQQEAAKQFGFSAKQTMVVAQRLYENGDITYMRTDSVNLASSALAQIQEVIKKQFGEKYALPAPRFYSNKSKGAQEAHEGIRPTNLAKNPEIASFHDRGQSRLYGLIWKRTVASQMQEALIEQTSATISAKNGNYLFRASGQVVKFDGFMRVYKEEADEDAKNSGGESTLPALEKDDILSLRELLPLRHFTEPPARYTDASLIKSLENNGIGRPSTYAPTLSTIQERGYVEKIEKKYHPTEIGILVNDLLVEHFPQIVDVGFTAHIEEELDDIAAGKSEWVPVIKEFYGPFKKNLLEKEKAVEKQVEISATPCPHCGKMMVMKFGRMGKFLACPDPESKVTLPMPEEAAKIKELQEKTAGERCPLCGKEMKVRRGRFGFFLGCVDYPKCKGVSKIWNKTGFKCPNCRVGDVVEKKSRGRGKPFFACAHYPDCMFAMNKKPESEKELDEALTIWKKKTAEKAAGEADKNKIQKPEARRKNKKVEVI